jgi:hypothetical protein
LVGQRVDRVRPSTVSYDQKVKTLTDLPILRRTWCILFLTSMVFRASI